MEYIARKITFYGAIYTANDLFGGHMKMILFVS